MEQLRQYVPGGRSLAGESAGSGGTAALNNTTESAVDMNSELRDVSGHRQEQDLHLKRLSLGQAPPCEGGLIRV